ncbi:MAG: carbamoyl phosphate synthase small subunit, partial [Deltaproteobacteria bacterium]
VSEDEAVARARAFGGLTGADLARVVTVANAGPWRDGSVRWESGEPATVGPQSDDSPHVVAYDFGVKRNILRMLVDRGCRVTLVPATTTADEALALAPDGVFLSNGPGDPEPVVYAQEAIRRFVDAGLPVFGICLGHQLLCLALGAQSRKMKFGHHGANHPVRDHEADRVLISSQNHGFAIDAVTLPQSLRVTHTSLFDGSLQGVAHETKPVFGFQGHPEASPGPHEVGTLFDRFVNDVGAFRARRGDDAEA